MSYSGYPNYGSLCGAPQNNQSTQDGFTSARPNVPTSTYPDSIADSTESWENRYASQDYSWHTPSPQSYSTIHTSQGQYAGGPYRNARNNQTYDYQRAHALHIQSNERQAETQSHLNSVSNAPKQPRTQALNELAYASGLEASSIQSVAASRSAQPTQRNHTPPRATGIMTRPESSTMALQQNYGQAQPSSHGSQKAYRTPDQTHLALQAAAALQGLPKSSRAGTASLVTDNTPPSQAPPQPRSQSPYVGPTSTLSHQGSQTSQGCDYQQPSVTNRVSKLNATSQPQPSRPQQPYTITPSNAGSAAIHPTNSIVSLVTNQSRQESPAYLSPTEQPSATTFINPREAFNPNHREHERVRREAAAVEVAAKTKAAEQALKAKTVPLTTPAAEGRPNDVIPKLSSMTAKSDSQPATKPKTTTSGPTGETGTEAEIRQIMARMKVLRDKDAALFQKVFDEEKGASASKSSGVSSVASQEPLSAIVHMTDSANHSFNLERPPGVANKRDAEMPRGFNGYTAVIEDNEVRLPDLGKFPAARRVRYSYTNRRQPSSPRSTPQLQLPPIPAPMTSPQTAVRAQPGRIVFDPNVAPESIPIVQPLSARGKDGTTIWPEASHQVLAAQAIKFLTSDPARASIRISEAEFVEMLRGKPSYIALCHMIENRGFRFDRTLFARCLMTHIPGLSASKRKSQPPPSPNPAPVLTQGLPPSAASAPFNPSAASHAPRFMNMANIKPKTQSQQFSATIPVVNQRNAPLAAHARPRLSVPIAQAPNLTPGSKEDKVRKRGFEDLIDLTKDDDEDYTVSEKRPRLQSSSPDPIAAYVQQSRPSSQQQDSVIRFGSPLPQGMLPKAVAPLRFDTRPPGSFPEATKRLPSSKVMLASKLNKAEALRRNYYDPKTVALDILISTGRHPTERPLNSHLAGLLGNHIELESDLSTLHWEDIDPGGPPASKIPWTDIPSGPPRFRSQKLESRKYNMLAKGDIDTKYQARQNLATEPPLGWQTPDLTNGLAAKCHILASKYSGSYGSGQFMKVQGPPTRKRKGRPPRHLASSESQEQCRAEESLRILAHQTKALVDESLKPVMRLPSSLRILAHQTKALVDESLKPVTRLPSSLRILAHQTKALVNESLKPVTRLPSSLCQSQAATNKAEPQSSQATPPKKRGRPPRQPNLSESSPPLPNGPPVRGGVPGPPWSAASHPIQVSLLQPAVPVHFSQRSVSVEIPKMEDTLWPNGKRRERPLGAKNKTPLSEKNDGSMTIEVVIPRVQAEDEPPEYPVFKCRWVRCGAELHNISTLRKHIAKLHKPAQVTVDAAGYGCYWKRCSLLRRDDEGNLEPTPISTKEEWLDHIDGEHIHPLGQRLGDGPSTTHIGKQNEPFEAIVSKYSYNPSFFPTDARIVSYTDPQAIASDRASYLANDSGRTTTHLSHYDDEPDAVILADFHTKDTESNKAAENAFKSFLKNHGHPKLDMRAAADETFKAMVVRKERTGVGIDRGGCTLINEERRKTFVQNPGISRVVEYDY